MSDQSQQATRVWASECAVFYSQLIADGLQLPQALALTAHYLQHLMTATMRTGRGGAAA